VIGGGVADLAEELLVCRRLGEMLQKTEICIYLTAPLTEELATRKSIPMLP
jgi:hypothetical protein